MVTADDMRAPLERLMRRRPFCEHFVEPNEHDVDELLMQSEVCRGALQSFAYYEIKSGGHLFIKHDSSKDGLNNLVKYWYLFLSRPWKGPIHLVHLVDDQRPATTGLCGFAGSRMERDVRGTRHWLLSVDGWHTGEWLDDLAYTLSEIIETNVL